MYGVIIFIVSGHSPLENKFVKTPALDVNENAIIAPKNTNIKMVLTMLLLLNFELK